VGEGFPLGWSPDGSLLAFLEGAEPGVIRVVNADGTGARTLVGGGGSFTEFEGWSADGQKLAFTLEAVNPETGDINSELRTVDLAGTQRLLHSHLGETWYSATWSPSSHVLAFRADSGIAVVDADSGATNVVANAEFRGGPVWSADGTKLLFSRGDGAGHNSLAVTELAGGSTSQLVSTGPIQYEQVASYSWSPAGNASCGSTPRACSTSAPTDRGERDSDARRGSAGHPASARPPGRPAETRWPSRRAACARSARTAQV
jgi:Tol biopolymer transport system component